MQNHQVYTAVQQQTTVYTTVQMQNCPAYITVQMQNCQSTLQSNANPLSLHRSPV